MQAACELHQEAIEALEREGRAGASGDVFRQAISALLRLGRPAEAIGLLLRWAAAAGEAGLHASQAKAYLGAVVVWLHAGDARQADAVYQARASPATFPDGEVFLMQLRACARHQVVPVHALNCGVRAAQNALSTAVAVRMRSVRWERHGILRCLLHACFDSAPTQPEEERVACAGCDGRGRLCAQRAGGRRRRAAGRVPQRQRGQRAAVRVWAAVLRPGQPGAGLGFQKVGFGD